jgi:hypothetical protein
MRIIKPLPGTLPMPGRPLADSVGLWPLNSLGNQVFDLSGNRNTGTLSGPIWVPGAKGGPALQFDGINDSVDCGSNASLFCAGDEITIVVSLRQKPGSAIQQYDTIVSRVSSIGGGYRIWTRNTTHYCFEVKDAVGVDWLTSTTAISSTSYQQIIAVCKANSHMHLYVNGVEEDSELALGNGWSDEPPLTMGMMPVNRRYFPMDMEYLYIFNRLLDVSEIALPFRDPFSAFPENIMPEFGIAV